MSIWIYIFKSPPIIAALKMKPNEESKLDSKTFGTVKGFEFFNPSKKLVGYIKGEEVFTASHFKVAHIKGGNICDNTNKKLISLNDAKKMMDCDYDGVTLAGFWYFFGRNSR